MRELLASLKHLGLVALKFSTEDEGLSEEALLARFSRIGDEIPIFLKIGGPDARADIALAVRYDLEGVVGPMIETPYAAQNFLKAVHSVPGADRLAKGVNLETIAASRAAAEILAGCEGKLTSVTIGRADMAASLSAGTEDEATWAASEAILRAAREAKIPVAVGGGVTPRTAREILRRLAPDRIETRNCVFEAARAPAAITRALAFEILLLELDLDTGRLAPETVRSRMQELAHRQADV